MKSQYKLLLIDWYLRRILTTELSIYPCIVLVNMSVGALVINRVNSLVLKVREKKIQGRLLMVQKSHGSTRVRQSFSVENDQPSQLISPESNGFFSIFFNMKTWRTPRKQYLLHVDGIE